jgi:hypothetical protein
MEDALLTLTEMEKAAQIKKVCIFELYDLDAAAFFAEHGYLVCYNVPVTLLEKLKDNKLLSDSIQKQLVPVQFVSQEISYLGVMKTLFPGKQIFTWDPHFSRFLNTDKLQQLLNDHRVGVILVNIKSQYYR